MKNKPTIILLCGGRGERLRPLTDKIPKPLVKIKNRPIISYLINYLLKEKFEKFVIATGYKSNLITRYIKSNYKKNKFSFVYSKKDSIIERIQNCTKKIDNDVIICYADTIANINFKKYLSLAMRRKTESIMTVYQPVSKFGVVNVGKKNLIESFDEKPTLKHWINIGYFFLNKNQFYNIQKFKDFILFIKNQIKRKKLLYFMHKNLHITVNSFTELIEAKKNIHHFK